MEAKIEIPQALKDALMAAVEKLHKARPDESYLTVDIGAIYACGMVSFRHTAYVGCRIFEGDTIEETVAKVPSKSDMATRRIAELKAELAKLEAA